MKPEPLKGKERRGFTYNFDKKDVASAVEWLKQQIKPTKPEETHMEVMNSELQEMGCDTRAKVHTFTLIKPEKVLELIDEAFSDCMEVR